MTTHKPVCIDLVGATLGERRFVESLLHVTLPELLDENELEVTARFQVSDDDDLLLHSNFLGLQNLPEQTQIQGNILSAS